MIAATNDAMIDYASNASALLERAPHAALLTLAQGTHMGFLGITSPWLQLWPNPDSVGCGHLSAVFSRRTMAATPSQRSVARSRGSS